MPIGGVPRAARGGGLGLGAPDPDYEGVEPPRRIDLAAGPAYLIRTSAYSDPSSLQDSIYLLGKQESLVTVVCTGTAHADDLGMSIVESIEFLPAAE